MRRWLWAIVPVAVLAVDPAPLPAQSEVANEDAVARVPPATVPGVGSGGAPLPYTGTRLYSGTYSVFGAPGYYGVAYGTASYGVPCTFSAFASPFGTSYGYGYAPYAYMPGRFGAGLWQSGSAGMSNVRDVGGYRTFPVPHNPEVVPPPLGYYAPGFGPPSYADW